MSDTIAIKYSPIYGKNNTKKNGHVATCRFAISVDININPIPYPIFLFSINFSIKNNSHINNMNVTNCALAAIYGFNAYIAPIVIINDIDLDFVNFHIHIYIKQ